MHLPFLRLYHCLAEDEVREAYLNQHETMDRPTLQSQNSANRPPNFKEIVAAKFNNASFEPESYAVPDLHEDLRNGKITPADLELNNKQMNEPIDSTQTIDVFFKRIDDCTQYATDGRVPYTPAQILQTGYYAVSTSGHYNEACKIWRRKANADKTWTTFKTYFAEEYHDLNEQQKVNTTQTNFHGANSVLDIGTALDNLAMAATLDRDIVKQLTQSNKQLVKMNAILTAQVKQSNETNNLLIKKLGKEVPKNVTNPLKSASNDGATKTTHIAPAYDHKAPFNHAAWLASLDPNGYCWTHGYKVQVGHTSRDCKGKLGGNDDTATQADNKGGSTKGKT
jgi:hypothetical protein